jgi:hypothetical protein
MSEMSESTDGCDAISADCTDLQKQRVEWRRKSWSIPDLRGEKQAWLALTQALVKQIDAGNATDLEALPDIAEITSPQPWRSYVPFLTGLGLASNQAGVLHLSDTGTQFFADSTPKQLADIIQDKVRLFGEVLQILATAPSTVEIANERLCRAYGLTWANLNNIRRRMDWLEVLGLIEDVGNRKWAPTASGKAMLEEWSIVSPEIFESFNLDPEDVDVTEPPVEIAALLQALADSPETHQNRSTYNIWVPSPNRISNLRLIVQAASERIAKSDFFIFIEEEFSLRTSSVESMLPFLKASGLLEEVERGVYLATAVAKAWLETGSDLDFIRILHVNMRFVGEMIAAAKNEIARNDLYSQAKPYGLNVDKARWIAGFLLESGLLEEPRYLYLKATPAGTRLVSSLPLEDIPPVELEGDPKPQVEKEGSAPLAAEVDSIPDNLAHLSYDLTAEKRRLEIVSMVISSLNQMQKTLGGLSPRDLYIMSLEKSVSPSLDELINVVETLSQPGIGVLRLVGELRDHENNQYVLCDAKRAVKQLRALAKIIEEALLV